LYPTDRDDEGNFYRLLRNYSNIGIELQAYLIDWEKMDGFPKSYLYVPADHELFIQRAYKDGLLTKEQISNINCKIIEECNLLISFGNGLKCTGADGSVIEGYTYSEEIECAKQEEVAIYTMPDLTPIALDALKLAIKFIIKAEG